MPEGKKKTRMLTSMMPAIVVPEPVDLEDEYPSRPIEWPKNGNKMKENEAKSDLLVQNPVFHEPWSLRRTPSDTGA